VSKEIIGSLRNPSLPQTSLIIPSRNRPEFLLRAVESILQADEVPTELIIIDQSAVPHSALAALTTDRPCEIRYLWSESVGASRARNIGIAAARYDILAFTDDDVMVTPTWFGALVRALLSAGPRCVVMGQVRLGEAERAGGFQLTVTPEDTPAVYEGRIGKDVLFSINMAMHRSAFKEVGNFDVRLGPGASFPSADDNDLGFRLLEAKYQVIYVPTAALYHRAWRTEKDYISLRWNYGRGQGAFYAKYLSLRDRYMLRRLAHEVMHYTYVSFWGMLHQRFRACGHAMYVLGILTGAMQWVLTQRRTR
jgi:GT2 family glycosyltransferase